MSKGRPIRRPTEELALARVMREQERENSRELLRQAQRVFRVPIDPRRQRVIREN